jgi:hypothetical protein
MAGASIEATLELWASSLREVKRLMRPLFAQERAAVNAGLFLDGLLGDERRKTGWMRAEAAGDPGPWRQQALLGRARWDADALRDMVREYVIEHLADDHAVLVVDETGFLKQGKASCGVARQYTGSAGKITNCQIGVFTAYVSRHGHSAILALAGQGIAIKDIVRRTGKSRGVVRQVVCGGRADVFRSRMNSLDPFTRQLETAWANGCRNGAALWRRVKAAGFIGSLRVVTEWASRQRKEEGMAPGNNWPRKSPSARGIARMMTTERDRPSKTVARMAAIIETAVPDLVPARDLMDRFHRMIQHRTSADLETWISDARTSLLASFTTGIVNDRSAVKAALTEPWSNGQTEGQNTKLKLVKRQMYGRAKLDLLRARLLGAQ